MESPYAAQQPNRAEGKIDRGWRLTQVAWRLIRSDRTMLVLALAGIGSATAAAFLVLALGGYFSAGHHSGGWLGPIALVTLYPSTLLSIFFNVALACAASAAFDGERMTTGEALRIAWGKRRQILLWSLLTCLVGTILAEIANRLPGGGPLDAVRHSGGLVKKRWGEGLTGGISIGAWAVVATIPLAIVLGIGAAVVKHNPGTGVVLIGTGLIGLCAVSVVVAATRQVFAVALYRYAIDAPIGGFATSDLEYPFTADPSRKKRKSWILRIGVPILGLMVLLIAIGIIVGPRHRSATEGYFHLDYTGAAPELRSGAPVVLDNRVIGTVLASQVNGSVVRITFQVNPRFDAIVASEPAYVVQRSGSVYIQVGGRAPPPKPNPRGPHRRPGTT